MKSLPQGFLALLLLSFAITWISNLHGQEILTSQLDQSLDKEFMATVEPLLKRYCYECHQGEEAESSIDLTSFRGLQSIRDKQSLWEQIRGIVRLGAMPPKDFDPQPTDQDRERIANWIHQALNAVDCGTPMPIPPVTTRRLNKLEYDNTIRDLFGVDLKPSREVGFVSDDVGNGFDNQGEVLTLSPLILEKYMQAAEWISQKVVSLDPNVLKSQSADMEPLMLNESGTTSFLCSAGKYKMTAKIFLSNSFGEELPAEGKAEIYFDDELLETVKTGKSVKDFRWERQVTDGIHTVTIKLIEQPDNIDEIAKNNKGYRGLRIRVLKLDGPSAGLPPMPIAHQKILVSKPSENVSVAEASRAIAANLLPKAFRRPCSEEDIDKFSKIITSATEAGWSFEESVQFGIQAILVAPDFLFRFEEEKNTFAPSKLATVETNASKIDEDKITDEADRTNKISNFPRTRHNSFVVANRLSYFLWSSMPDETATTLATNGGFASDQEVMKQVDRMIQDDKSDAFIFGFFEQWLGLRNLKLVDVDEKAFPLWTDPLREAMEKETFLFCKNLLREGKVGDILSAPYTFVNPRLAEYYGMKFEGRDPAEMYPKLTGRRNQTNTSRRLGRYENEDKWIRVDLPEQRRGLLTHASILTLTSNPTRTSPVKRGKWVLENILGDPPPPAPPGVPSLEKSTEGHKNLTLRQQLELHRADPGCASCHNVLDPIGLGLENFNSVGQWRTEDRKQLIDSQGKLQDGREFSGPRELLAILESDQEKVAKHFISQMLTYALGRGLVRQDRCTIDNILIQTSKNGYRIADIVQAIALSESFLYRSSASKMAED